MKLLANAKASTQAIRDQLSSVRQAEERAKQRLVQARHALRSLLTLRQEAYLVTTRTLD